VLTTATALSEEPLLTHTVARVSCRSVRHIALRAASATPPLSDARDTAATLLPPPSPICCRCASASAHSRRPAPRPPSLILAGRCLRALVGSASPARACQRPQYTTAAATAADASPIDPSDPSARSADCPCRGRVSSAASTAAGSPVLTRPTPWLLTRARDCDVVSGSSREYTVARSPAHSRSDPNAAAPAGTRSASSPAAAPSRMPAHAPSCMLVSSTAGCVRIPCSTSRAALSRGPSVPTQPAPAAPPVHRALAALYTAPMRSDCSSTAPAHRR